MNRETFQILTRESDGSSASRGFTLVELLVLLVVIALLATLLLPALATARQKPHAVQCLNNHRQMTLAASQYAEDNNGVWVPNEPGFSPAWVSGNMDWNVGNTNNTNVALLTNVTLSVLAPYIKDIGWFHCPEDISIVAGEGARVRSISMNGAVGTFYSIAQSVNGQWLTGVNIGAGRQTTWRCYGKTSDMVNPAPSSLFIFCDEHPDSINDAQFAVQMAFTGPFATIIDFPASWHNGAGTFSFADGHAEVHKWLGQTIQPPIVFPGSFLPGQSQGMGTAVGDSGQDVVWLQQHTSAHL